MKKLILLITFILLITTVQAGTLYHLGDFNAEVSKEFTGYEGDAFDFLFNGNEQVVLIKDIQEKKVYIKVFPNKGAATGAPIAQDRYAIVDLDKDDVNDFKIELNNVIYDQKIASLIITRINEDPVKEYDNKITGKVVKDDSLIKADFKIGAIISIVVILLGFLIFKIFSKK